MIPGNPEKIITRNRQCENWEKLFLRNFQEFIDFIILNHVISDSRKEMSRVKKAHRDYCIWNINKPNV